jgi:hypothetical protein
VLLPYLHVLLPCLGSVLLPYLHVLLPCLGSVLLPYLHVTLADAKSMPIQWPYDRVIN